MPPQGECVILGNGQTMMVFDVFGESFMIRNKVLGLALANPDFGKRLKILKEHHTFLVDKCFDFKLKNFKTSDTYYVRKSQSILSIYIIYNILIKKGEKKSSTNLQAFYT